ncbi:MAG TPA: glycosyltransferase family 4 protein [Candidatus Paceibacterota bacterium]|nr:glycosyltransferase family 4 protein [Candidatus Paceibacterota bacterium]
MNNLPKKLKILELTNFSAGSCGVFTRVLNESMELKKLGYEVKIFSSNLVKGIDKLAPETELFQGISITRFKSKKLGGESFMSWFNKETEKKATEFNPDIIIAHSYRHPHTHKAVKLANKLKKTNQNTKCFLVTHSPFIENNITRSFFEKLVVNFYDYFIGLRLLNKFDKVITITKGEDNHLEKLGLTKSKIVYIPNGIPSEFFLSKKSQTQNKILFLGRISPVKNLEILIQALSNIQDKKIILEIVGPAEKTYKQTLIKIIKSNNLERRVIFTDPIYDLKSKIKKIDSAKIFVLPSKSEAMPQSLIEAMAREKTVLSSDNSGSKELIEDGKTGYLFKNEDISDLTEKLNLVLSTKNKDKNNKVAEQAKIFVEQFNWDKLIKKLISIF